MSRRKAGIKTTDTSSPQARTPYATIRPAISDAMLARVRAAAHRYVMGGGPLILSPETDTPFDEQIADVRLWLFPESENRFHARLDALRPVMDAGKSTDLERPSDALWGDVWTLVSDQGEAAFLFGVLVGWEVVALTQGSRADLKPPRVADFAKVGRR
jgi:hypothetical protein